MVQTYQPPLMEVAQDTLYVTSNFSKPTNHKAMSMFELTIIRPELQPIFTFLNSHSNKLYQEGYFLKLHDLDTRGRPSVDRTWQECFAQLVGTILSLWDASELDAAGDDGEVVPSFINLADASIKMVRERHELFYQIWLILYRSNRYP
jgi:CCR4-NOT transcriptional complex subunit CAF120